MSANDFYDIAHEDTRLTLPRVTSILRVIDRSGPLMGWATRLERESLRAALEDVLTTPGELGPQQVWERMQATLSGKRAWVRSLQDAADIGKAAHASIRWHTARLLGIDPGPEPSGPDAAMQAVCAWLEWCKAVDFRPLHAERMVYCPFCGYAGTIDALGLVSGKLMVVDYKTAKATYPEHHLQVGAYRHACAREGLTTDGGLILRLPKTAADPQFEAVPAIEYPHGAWRAICTVWRLMRWLDGDDYGSTVMQPCAVRG